MLTNLYFKVRCKALVCKEKMNSFLRDESGAVDIIAIIVVLAIVLALAIIFRNQIVKLFDQIWDTIWKNNNQDYNGKYGTV